MTRTSVRTSLKNAIKKSNTHIEAAMKHPQASRMLKKNLSKTLKEIGRLQKYLTKADLID